MTGIVPTNAYPCLPSPANPSQPSYVVIGANAKLRKFERVSKRREARPQIEDGSDGDNEGEDTDSELEEVEARM